MPATVAEAKPEQARKKGVLALPARMERRLRNVRLDEQPDSALCFRTRRAKPAVHVGPGAWRRAVFCAGRNRDAIWCFDEVLKGDHKTNKPT